MNTFTTNFSTLLVLLFAICSYFLFGGQPTTNKSNFPKLNTKTTKKEDTIKGAISIYTVTRQKIEQDAKHVRKVDLSSYFVVVVQKYIIPAVVVIVIAVVPLIFLLLSCLVVCFVASIMSITTINTSQLADNGCREDAHTSTPRLHQTPSPPNTHNGLVLTVQHKKNKKIKKEKEEDEEKEKEKEKAELEKERSPHAPKRQETLCRGAIVSARMFILMILSVSTVFL